MRYELKEYGTVFLAVIQNMNYIIDPATPVSFMMYGGSLVVEGEKFQSNPLRGEAMYNLMKRLEDQYGVYIEGIVGNDIISKYGLILNRKERFVQFGTYIPKECEELDIEEISAIDKYKSVIIKNLLIHGAPLRAAISTYADISYALPSVCHNTMNELQYFCEDENQIYWLFFENKKKHRENGFKIVNDKKMLFRMRGLNAQVVLKLKDLADDLIVFDFENKKLYLK